MDNYKITLFYAKMHFYVPTNNFLWEHMRSNYYNEVKVIDVSVMCYEDIIQIAEKSDAIFIDHSIRYAVGAKERAGTVFYFDEYKSAEEYQKIWIGLLSLPVRKAYSLVLSDMQSMKNPHHQECMEPFFDFWLDHIDCVFWGYEHSKACKKYVNTSYLDEYLNHVGTTDPAINRNLILDKNIITVDFPHFVDESELTYSGKIKRWDWIISGALYGTRKIANNSLIATGLVNVPNLDKFRWVINTILKKTRIYLGISKLSLYGMKFNAAIFRFLISRTEMTFVCGSAYRYMVRKFFEIPACKSVMIAYSADGMDEYGFVDGVHYMSCEPGDSGQVALKLKKDPALRESLRCAAFDLISASHTTNVRVNQLINVMRSLASGKLINARYESGKFVIKEKI